MKTSRKNQKISEMRAPTIFHIWKERNQRLHTQKETWNIQLWKTIEMESQILLKKFKTQHKYSDNFNQIFWRTDSYEEELETLTEWEIQL